MSIIFITMKLCVVLPPCSASDNARTENSSPPVETQGKDIQGVTESFVGFKESIFAFFIQKPSKRVIYKKINVWAYFCACFYHFTWNLSATECWHRLIFASIFSFHFAFKLSCFLFHSKGIIQQLYDEPTDSFDYSFTYPHTFIHSFILPFTIHLLISMNFDVLEPVKRAKAKTLVKTYNTFAWKFGTQHGTSKRMEQKRNESASHIDNQMNENNYDTIWKNLDS